MITVWVVFVSYQRQEERVSCQKPYPIAERGTRVTYDDARLMNVQHPLPGIVRSMNLHEVGLEIIRDMFIIVGSFAVGCDTVKALRSCKVVPGNHETNGRTISKPGCLEPISSATDRSYLCPIKSVRKD
jgi:hypothetical protein